MSSAYTNCGWNNETRPESGPMYYSERGEDCPPKLYKDLNEMSIAADNVGAEYVYHFEDGTWKCHALCLSGQTDTIMEMQLNTVN
jgi:hypothetical protein